MQHVLRRDRFQHRLFRRLLNFATDQQLVEDEIRLFEVENDVQLAHGAEVFVEQLDVPGREQQVGVTKQARKVTDG